jgi:hypothetical protein
VAIVGYDGEVIGRPRGTLSLQLHSTFTPNTCSTGHSKGISWGLVSRDATIAWPCKWQSQEQLPLQRSCSPMEQTTVLEPGYGQLVLILVPPSETMGIPTNQTGHIARKFSRVQLPDFLRLSSARRLPPIRPITSREIRPPTPVRRRAQPRRLDDGPELRAEPGSDQDRGKTATKLG